MDQDPGNFSCFVKGMTLLEQNISSSFEAEPNKIIINKQIMSTTDNNKLWRFEE